MSTEPPLNFNSGRDNPPDDDFVAPSPLGHHVRADHGELRRCDFSHKMAETATLWLKTLTAKISLKNGKRVATRISMS